MESEVIRQERSTVEGEECKEAVTVHAQAVQALTQGAQKREQTWGGYLRFSEL